MSETVRTFVALAPGPEQRAAIASAVRRARRTRPERARRFRWNDPATAHLTLAFLGEVERARGDELVRTVAEVAQRHAPFPWAFGDAGAFPSADRVRVAWIGLRTGEAATRALAADLAATLASAGWTLDERPFHPHLTVARARGRPEPGLPIDAAVTPAALVTEVVVMTSRLASDGARHTPLVHLPMAGSAGAAGSPDGAGPA